MKTLLMTLGLFMMAAGSVSFSQATSNSVKQEKKKAVAIRVSKQEFKSKLAATANAQLVDVRTPSEFANGTIEGAVNMDYYAVDFQEQIQSIDPTKAVFIFCQSGGRSGKTLKKMAAMGFSEVYELEGGFGAWKK